jgi:hypothetical protein
MERPGAGGGSGGSRERLLSIHVTPAAAASVQWPVLLRLVARISALTLNPPPAFSGTAGNVSVFTAAKAVNQLLYVQVRRRACTRGRGGEHVRMCWPS